MGKFLEAFNSLFAPSPNRLGDGTESLSEGVQEQPISQLTLTESDESLLALAKRWRTDYEAYEEKIGLPDKTKKNKEYWKGQQYTEIMTAGTPQLQDNLIFESTETWLPLATRQNPEPVVYIDDSKDGEALAKDVRDGLAFHADRLSLRLKLKDEARHWAMNYIGCIKVGFDMVEDDLTAKTINPRRLILDPDGYIVAGRYYGEYIGEVRSDSAEKLIQRFPKQEEAIKLAVNDKLGTKCTYTEWWTNEYVFFTFKSIVLGKTKNPHWNYEETTTKTDEYGRTYTIQNSKINHFATQQMPYTFLSIFSLGEQPHDETCLIEQVISLQDAVNKRHRQVDKNVDGMNNSVVFGGGLDAEQATRAKAALDKGGAVLLQGVSDVNAAFKRDAPPPLPQQVFGTIEDYRNEIRNIFGTRGSTPQGIVSEETVGGKMAIRGQDVDRISLAVDYIEQQVDYIFNWFLQLMYVYYDEPHMASVIGEDKARRFFQLSSQQMKGRKIIVSVKEGSMIPKDSLTRANQAVDLYNAGALDPLSLHEQLETADPQEAAKRAYLYRNAPELYQQEYLNVGPQGQPQPGQLGIPPEIPQLPQTL